MTLDALGLLRCRRVVLRGIGEETEVLGALVSLIENVTSGIFADTPADEVRAAATMVKAASVQLGETSLNLAAYLGAMKLIADLDGITIEEPTDEERAEFVTKKAVKSRSSRS